MDSVNDPKIKKIVFMSSSQVGKTEALLNIIGYYTSNDPAPIMILLPTKELCGAFSTDRLSVMFRDTPCLSHVLKNNSKLKKNSVLHKTFSGGSITLAGSNAPASLSSRPIRILLADEIDRMPSDSGGEGNPLMLAMKRTTTFWNKKIILVSTPTIKGNSNIENAFEESDKRFFYVPCPYCKKFQILKWSNLKWKDNKPETALYYCDICNKGINENQKLKIVQKGYWKASLETTDTAGFWLNELYSPWVTHKEMASNFLKAKKKGRENIKVFVNTSLGETFTEEQKQISDNKLYERRENYNGIVPNDAIILVCAVDVQKNRLELIVDGYGKGEECWTIEHHVIPGDPTTKYVWEQLDLFLNKTWEHATGARLKISITVVDHGGHWTKIVEDYVRTRQRKQIFAIKGRGGSGVPFVSLPSVRKIGKNDVSPLITGTDTGKDNLFSRLDLKEPGAGYCHFPDTCDMEFFKQLASSEIKLPKYKKGVKIGYYYKKIRAANEILDLKIYSMAAYSVLKMTDEMLESYFKKMTNRGIEKAQDAKIKKRKKMILHPGY